MKAKTYIPRSLQSRESFLSFDFFFSDRDNEGHHSSFAEAPVYGSSEPDQSCHKRDCTGWELVRVACHQLRGVSRVFTAKNTQLLSYHNAEVVSTEQQWRWGGAHDGSSAAISSACHVA